MRLFLLFLTKKENGGKHTVYEAWSGILATKTELEGKKKNWFGGKLKKENEGKFEKQIWRQIKKTKIAGNIQKPIWREKLNT